MNKSKISVQDLNLFYGNFQAIYDVNLEIPANMVTAFIGPSGCGKSTLLKTFNRMNDLVVGCRTEGKVLIDDENIFENIDVNLLRKKVGMVFQTPNLFRAPTESNEKATWTISLKKPCRMRQSGMK